MSDQDDLDVFKKLGIDPADYLNTRLRNAGYQIVRRTDDYIDVTHDSETRRKHFDHPRHAENALNKLLRDEKYFEDWTLLEAE